MVGKGLNIQSPIPSNKLIPPCKPLRSPSVWGDLKSICSVYLPSIEQISAHQILQLIDQLPKPTMIGGDMNAHKHISFDGRLDTSGGMLQSAIETENLLILNEDQPTFYKASDQASFHIDQALITDTCPTEYNWNILDDLHGSDHYPIQIIATRSSPIEYTERWNLEKADWEAYRDLAASSG